jgi:acetylornithine deacetylase
MAPMDLSAREILEKLISFDTTSRNSNLALIDFVEEYLASHGLKGWRVYDDTGLKTNLYVSAGPDEAGGIVLSGHVDVVPVDGQDWATDPFCLTEKDGKLYGRGTCDMKGFVALSLWAVPQFQKRGLKKPVHLAISYDEEVGCIGVRGMLQRLAGQDQRPGLCIVGEPTEFQPIVAHKGKWSFIAKVRGKECHSSLAPTGVNAVEYAAEAVTWLRREGRRFAAEGIRDELYDLAHTTVHVGTLNGGTALNIVPQEASFVFEYRYIAQDNPDDIHQRFLKFIHEELEPEMQAIDPSAGFSIESISQIPGLEISPEHEVVNLARQLSGRNDHAKVAYGTEAGLFQEIASIPTVVCGPGSIEQAHKPNEFLTLDQLAKGEAFMQRLGDRVCAV